MRVVVFGSNSRAYSHSICILSSVAIERPCSILANHAQTCQPASSLQLAAICALLFIVINGANFLDS
jgi:hypothetical protein